MEFSDYTMVNEHFKKIEILLANIVESLKYMEEKLAEIQRSKI